MRVYLPALTVACVGSILASLLGASSADAALGRLDNAAVKAAPRITKAAFYCSPGFELNYAEQCVAVPSRAQVELFVDQPIYEPTEPVVRHYRRHRTRNGIRERY